MATALYRRYRPESFADVIGQDHVTTPLRRALRAGRIGHAYLFSGPRGCGKTTSARILARCLNCAQGPTDTPCGTCDSCRDLSRGGAGSLDVVEIDAASHGGVDDARELRERATFAPARDRYKVFIIDEAHMVTSAGFNALLKLVEEPPEHVKFIFATTEPDKVIGTIRSRTHHYPFRLIPPQVLAPYLETVCAAEGVHVGDGVLPLVVRAGGGSARDTMSVLDQLMAGAGEDGLDHSTAISLLGFTDSALLDLAITAIGQRDGAGLYGAVEQVLATGHEPRRFVEDLLERVRDLIVLSAVPEGGAELLPHVPAEDLEQMRGQALAVQPPDLSRCGDLIHETLATMSGATSPRLHLELLAARLVLRDDRGAPAAAAPRGQAPQQGRDAVPSTNGGGGGRDDARRIAQEQADAARRARSDSAAHGGPARTGSPQSTPAASVPDHGAPTEQAPDPAVTQQPAQGEPPARTDPRPVATSDDGWGAVAEPGSGRPAARSKDDHDRAQQATPEAVRVAPSAATAPSAYPEPRPIVEGTGTPGQQAEVTPPVGSGGGHAPGASGGEGGLDVASLRGHWSAILDELSQIRRPAWALVSQNGHVHEVSGRTVVIGFATDGLLSAFRRGTTEQNLSEAIRRVTHLAVEIDAVVGEDPGDESGPSDGEGPSRGGSGGGAGGHPGGAPGSGGPPGPEDGPGPRRTPGPVGDSWSSDTTGSGSASDRTGGRPRGDAGSPSGGASRSNPAGPPRSDGPSRGSSRGRTSANSAPVPDFAPEPDDPYPPDPYDDPAYGSSRSGTGASAPTGDERGAPRRDATPPSSEPVGEVSTGSRGSDRRPAAASSITSAASAPGSSSPAGESPTSRTAPLIVEDERRDDVPDGEPRTHGQAALRRAIADGRVARTRELPRSGSTSVGVPSDPPAAESAHSDRSARSAPEATSPTGPDSPEQAATTPEAWGDVVVASATEAGDPSSTSLPTGAAAAGSGAVSWEPAATPATSSAQDTAGTGSGTYPGGTDASTPAAEARGAELARRAAQASRAAAQDRQSSRPETPAARPDPVDVTGGASRDDADATSVTTRNGREVIETVLGGRVLEVIDETRG